LKKFDESQLLFVNRLLKTFLAHNNLFIHCAVTNIKCLKDVEDKLRVNCLSVDEESDIPILMELLASPRPDGQQRVVFLYFAINDLKQKMLETIKMVQFGILLSPQTFKRLNLNIIIIIIYRSLH
jgi:hypothetical protein